MYTIQVSGTGGTTGNFRIGTYLNTALETESHEGTTNDTLGTAQRLTDTFITINGSPQSGRGAVLGGLSGGLETVPEFLETTAGNGGNAWPFHIGEFGVPSMRYQQVYSANEFVGGGLLDELRFRRLSGQPAFEASDIDVKISVGYAATTVATVSNTFADNIGTEFLTVFDGLLDLSSSGVGRANMFDVVIDVADLFDYDPSRGDLLIDIEMRSSPTTAFFNISGQGEQSTTTRIWNTDVNDPTGIVGYTAYDSQPYGLVTQFNFVPDAQDYYSFELSAGQSATIAFTTLTGGSQEVVLISPTGEPLALGDYSTTNVDTIISNFVATSTGTYSLLVSGQAGTYSLVVNRNVTFDSESNDSLELAQPILGPEVNGRRWVMGDLGGLTGDSSPTDPVSLPVYLDDGSGFLWDIFGSGDINNGTYDAYDGGLIHQGFPYFSNAATEDGGREIVIGEAVIGDVVVTRKIYVPADGTFARFLEIVTNTSSSTVDYTVPIFTNLGSDGGESFIQTSSGDSSFDSADDWIITDDYDAGGDPTMLHVIAGDGGQRPVSASRYFDNLYYDYNLSLAPGETQIVMHFASQNLNQADALARAPELADLAEGTLAGMTTDELSQVVNFAIPVGSSSDFYKINADGNSKIEIETSLPAIKSGEFVNLLDPMVRLYDAAGNLLASNDNGASDGRNAKLSYKVPKNGGGNFYVEVLASTETAEPTRGEYILSVKGANAAQESFEVTSTVPADEERLYGAPSQITVNVNDNILLPTLEGSDLRVDGVPASGVKLNDGDTAVFGLRFVYEFDGHYYTLTTEPTDWISAEAEANALGGHLVAVNSQNENDFLERILFSASKSREAYWIGFTDAAVEGEFVWTSGDPVTYTNWRPGEPNDFGAGQDYTSINWHYSVDRDITRGTWDDSFINGSALNGPFLGIIELAEIPDGFFLATEGTHYVTIGAGAIQDVQGTPIAAYNGTFFVDYTAPHIVSSSIQQNDIVTADLQDFRITIGFSEAMDTSNVDLYDVSLAGQVFGNFYYPSELIFNDEGTELTISFSGIALSEDQYRLTLFSGDFGFQDLVGLDLDGETPDWPIPDNASGDGLEGGDFVVDFALDAGTRSVPVPLVPVHPLGSLVVYTTAVAASGAIVPDGDTDDWTIELDPGQTISVLLSPSLGLVGSIEVLSPVGVTLGSASGGAANDSVLLQTVAAVDGGTYVVRVGGAPGSIGTYSFEVLVNAAYEDESNGGPSNNSSPQDIDGSFISLPGGASRGAVLGTADGGPNYVASAEPFAFEDISATGTAALELGNYRNVYPPD